MREISEAQDPKITKTDGSQALKDIIGDAGTKEADWRPKYSYDDLLARIGEPKQNDLSIIHALSKRDLDMALNYVLDQAFTLESVTVGIIERFEMRSKGQAIPEDHLG